MRIFFLFLTTLTISSFSFAQTQQDTIYAYPAKSPVVIDGSDADQCWIDAEWNPISVVWLPYYNAPMEEGDFSGRFKLAWDSLYLYILVEVVDDSLSDDHINPFDNYWNDDCVEIFIDEDRSMGYHQNNYNAFAYHVSITYDAIDGGTGNNVNLKNNLSVVMDTIGEKTYLWEIALKVYDKTFNPNNPEASRVTLFHNKLMGFSLAYCDNDETTSRENFIGSTFMPSNHSNDNYITADYMGTLLLVDPDYSGGTSVRDISKKKVVQIFPNPADDYITVQFSSEIQQNKNMEIVDLNGRSVMEINNVISGQQINIGNLPKGVYSLKFISGNISDEKMFIKR
ncbi:MAG: T9SS type A sorting domain-containing protein [Prolixibacteraceae bacterium]|nr:T9SS type A sorting domain-containing protein [Prolixibacteraceae bacterium]